MRAAVSERWGFVLVEGGDAGAGVVERVVGFGRLAARVDHTVQVPHTLFRW